MKFWTIGTVAAALALAGCDGREAPAPGPSEEPTDLSREEAPVSIMRPDVEVERVKPALADLDARVPFADGGTDLSPEALAELQTIMASPQMAAGGPIVLRGHSDSAGNDDANLRASQARAEAVRDYLVEQGVAPDRIRIIALGEHRPIAPNATLEGKPDEEGRARNRRVDVFIGAVEESAAVAPSAQTQTLAETVATE